MSPMIRWSTFGCALGLGLAVSHGVEAQTVAASGYGYHGAQVQAFDESYAGPVIRGDYVGAPLTRFPRPTELVPSAWGYGTYGVPTIAGIRPASVGTPTVYVIDTPPRAQRQVRSAGPRIVSRNRRGHWSSADRSPSPGMMPMASAHAGAKVVTVNVGRTASR